MKFRKIVFPPQSYKMNTCLQSMSSESFSPTARQHGLEWFPNIRQEPSRKYRDSERPEAFLRDQILFKRTVLFLPRCPPMKNAVLIYKNC